MIPSRTGKIKVNDIIQSVLVTSSRHCFDMPVVFSGDIIIWEQAYQYDKRGLSLKYSPKYSPHTSGSTVLHNAFSNF